MRVSSTAYNHIVAVVDAVVVGDRLVGHIAETEADRSTYCLLFGAGDES